MPSKHCDGVNFVLLKYCRRHAVMCLKAAGQGLSCLVLVNGSALLSGCGVALGGHLMILLTFFKFCSNLLNGKIDGGAALSRACWTLHRL